MSATRSQKQHDTVADQLEQARQSIEEYMKAIQAELVKIQAVLETLA